MVVVDDYIRGAGGCESATGRKDRDSKDVGEMHLGRFDSFKNWGRTKVLAPLLEVEQYKGA